MEITSGIHTVEQILSMVDITVDQAYDRRRISIGGLGFDSTDEIINVVGEVLAIKLDGEVVGTFAVI